MQEIELDLQKHCIETAIKGLHNRLLSEYFHSKGSDTPLEIRLALLEKALRRFDFSALRAAHDELAGQSGCRITLRDNDPHPPHITIDGRLIDTGEYIKGRSRQF